MRLSALLGCGTLLVTRTYPYLIDRADYPADSQRNGQDVSFSVAVLSVAQRKHRLRLRVRFTTSTPAEYHTEYHACAGRGGGSTKTKIKQNRTQKKYHPRYVISCLHSSYKPEVLESIQVLFSTLFSTYSKENGTGTCAGRRGGEGGAGGETIHTTKIKQNRGQKIISPVCDGGVHKKPQLMEVYCS